MINDLYELIEKRKRDLPKDSYITSLFKEGGDKIIQKVGEESVEVVIAAKGKVKQRVIEEFADLLFHSLILLSYLGIKPKEILEELEKRKK
jgi:phosphoribosyl-ATP pyrophosphohydrolase